MYLNLLPLTSLPRSNSVIFNQQAPQRRTPQVGPQNNDDGFRLNPIRIDAASRANTVGDVPSSALDGQDSREKAEVTPGPLDISRRNDDAAVSKDDQKNADTTQPTSQPASQRVKQSTIAPEEPEEKLKSSRRREINANLEEVLGLNNQDSRDYSLDVEGGPTGAGTIDSVRRGNNRSVQFKEEYDLSKPIGELYKQIQASAEVGKYSLDDDRDAGQVPLFSYDDSNSRESFRANKIPVSNINRNQTQDVHSILKNSKVVFPRDSNASESRLNVSDLVYGAKLLREDSDERSEANNRTDSIFLKTQLPEEQQRDDKQKQKKFDGKLYSPDQNKTDQIETALNRGNQKIISEEKSKARRRRANIETFGYADPIKNQVITESLIDDIQGKRQSLFQNEYSLNLNDKNQTGLRHRRNHNQAAGGTGDPLQQFRTPLTGSQSTQSIQQSDRITNISFQTSSTTSKFKRKPMPGKYSFARVKLEDFKSISHDQQKLLENYRSSIQKLLTQLQRTPIENRDQLREQVKQLTKELEEIQDKVDTYDPTIQKMVAQKYEHMTIFDPNHPSNQSYHERKQKAINDQRIQNQLNSGLPVFKDNQSLALPPPSSSSQSQVNKRKITIGTSHSEYVFKQVDADDQQSEYSIIGPATGSELSKPLKRSDQRLNDRKQNNTNSRTRNHEFSVILGSDAEEAKRSFNPAVATVQRLDLEREHAVVLSKNEATCTALLPIQEEMTMSRFRITKKQNENLSKLFKFYSAQHETKNLSNYTFEQYEKAANRMVVGDYNQFCKDFDIPLCKDDQREVFRKKSIRTGNAVTFETFEDILKEIFYIKDTEERVMIKRKEIKMLEESNLKWSMEQMDQAKKDLNELLKGERDKQLDHVYLWQAHNYLQTTEAAQLFGKAKSAYLPFSQKVLKGDKVDQYNYEQYDSKGQSYVKQPQTGIKIVEDYDAVVSNYFQTKQIKKDEQLKQIRADQRRASNAVQENRKRYERFKNSKVFQPQDLKSSQIKEKRQQMISELLNKSVDNVLDNQSKLSKQVEPTDDQIAKNLKIIDDEERLSMLSQSPISQFSAKQSQLQKTANLVSSPNRDPYYGRGGKIELFNRTKDSQKKIASDSKQNWSNIGKVNLKYKEEKEISELLGAQAPTKPGNAKPTSQSPDYDRTRFQNNSQARLDTAQVLQDAQRNLKNNTATSSQSSKLISFHNKRSVQIGGTKMDTQAIKISDQTEGKKATYKSNYDMTASSEQEMDSPSDASAQRMRRETQADLSRQLNNRKSNQFSNSDAYGLGLGMSANQFQALKNSRIQFKQGEIGETKYNVASQPRPQYTQTKSTEQLGRFEKLPTLTGQPSNLQSSNAKLLQANQTSKMTPARVSRHLSQVELNPKRLQNQKIPVRAQQTNMYDRGSLPGSDLQSLNYGNDGSSPYQLESTKYNITKQAYADDESAALARANNFKQNKLRAQMFNSIDAAATGKFEANYEPLNLQVQQAGSPAQQPQGAYGSKVDGVGFVDQLYNSTIDQQKKQQSLGRELRLADAKRKVDRAFESHNKRSKF